LDTRPKKKLVQVNKNNEVEEIQRTEEVNIVQRKLNMGGGATKHNTRLEEKRSKDVLRMKRTFYRDLLAALVLWAKHGRCSRVQTSDTGCGIMVGKATQCR
jgi:RNase P/RNase MRP subunit POP5